MIKLPVEVKQHLCLLRTKPLQEKYFLCIRVWNRLPGLWFGSGHGSVLGWVGSYFSFRSGWVIGQHVRAGVGPARY